MLKQPFDLFQKHLIKSEGQEHSSKYSNRIFSNHLLLFYLVVGFADHKSYRRTEFYVKTYLKPKRTPDHTTLQKVLKRIPKQWFDLALEAFSKIRKEVWLDGTGFSQYYSKYYALRIDRFIVRKSFEKAVLSADKQGFVLGCAFQKGGCEAPALKELVSFRGLKTVYADKGYDSSENFVLCKEQGIEPI